MATQPKTKPKRARRAVESTFADKWEPQNEGDVLEGTFIGVDTAPGKRRGETFTVYHIQDDDGKRWSASGAHLESFMKQIPRGTYVWITFEGTKKVSNGDMNLYKVDVEEGVELKDVLAPPDEEEEEEEEED